MNLLLSAGPKKRVLYRWGMLVIILLLACIYYKADPAVSGYFPRCPFHMLTGYNCPGCGFQRALHHLLHLEIGQAIRYNLLAIPAVLLLIHTLTVRILEFYRPRKQVKNLLYRPAALIVTGMLVLSFWIFRNLPAYPFQH